MTQATPVMQVTPSYGIKLRVRYGTTHSNNPATKNAVKQNLEIPMQQDLVVIHYSEKGIHKMLF